MLAGIDLDSGPRSQDPAYRLAKNIRISMLYLEDDDSVSAESYIKKASALIGASADQGLELQYKVRHRTLCTSTVSLTGADAPHLNHWVALNKLPKRVAAKVQLQSLSNPAPSYHAQETAAYLATREACSCCVVTGKKHR